MSLTLVVLVVVVVTISLALVGIHFCLGHKIQKFDGFRSVFIYKQGERYNYIQAKDTSLTPRGKSTLEATDSSLNKEKRESK